MLELNSVMEDLWSRDVLARGREFLAARGERRLWHPPLLQFGKGATNSMPFPQPVSTAGAASQAGVEGRTSRTKTKCKRPRGELPEEEEEQQPMSDTPKRVRTDPHPGTPNSSASAPESRAIKLCCFMFFQFHF